MAEIAIISATELKARLDSGEVIDVIDVREDWELKIMQLPFARQIRMIEVLTRLDDISRERPTILICRTGSRSGRTIEMLMTRGYTNLLNLDGGILAWAHEVDPTMPQFYT